MEQKKPGRIRKFFSWIGFIIELILCILLIPIIVINTIVIVKTYTNPEHIPGALGYKAAIVMSGSMEPEIKTGSIIVLQDVKDTSALEVGDVICFMSGESAVTHRINAVSRTDDGVKYITKGDANNAVDATAVTEDKIEGQYKGIQFEGWGNFALFMQTTKGIILSIVLPLILIVIYDAIRRMIADRKEKKSRGQLEEELERLRSLAQNNGETGDGANDDPEVREPQPERAKSEEHGENEG